MTSNGMMPGKLITTDVWLDVLKQRINNHMLTIYTKKRFPNWEGTWAKGPLD